MKKKKNRLIKILLLLIMACMVISKIMSSGATNELIEDHKEGYAICDYVEGITFDVPEKWLLQAETITIMSEKDEEYLKGLWLVKSNSKTYKLFQNNTLVLFAASGTEFHNRSKGNDDEWTWLSNASLLNTWFSMDKTKYSDRGPDGNAEKTLMTAVGDVSINPQVYGTYVGRLAIIYDGTNEWAVFAGVQGEDFDSLTNTEQELICHICSSVRYNDKTIPTPVDKEIEQENIKEIPVKEITKIPSPLPTQKENNDEKDENKEYVPISVTPTPVKADENKNILIPEAKESTIENPLSMGDCGLISCIGTEVQVNTYVQLDKIYKGKDAEKLIKSYVSDVPEAPAAQKYFVAEFTAGISPDQSYISSKLSGTDGETLTFNGVKNSDKTHDILSHTEKVTKGYSKYYIYYLIPNGCEEYMLQFGEQSLGVIAYYKIENKK